MLKYNSQNLSSEIARMQKQIRFDESEDADEFMDKALERNRNQLEVINKTIEKLELEKEAKISMANHQKEMLVDLKEKSKINYTEILQQAEGTKRVLVERGIGTKDSKLADIFKDTEEHILNLRKELTGI